MHLSAYQTGKEPHISDSQSHLGINKHRDRWIQQRKKSLKGSGDCCRTFWTVAARRSRGCSSSEASQERSCSVQTSSVRRPVASRANTASNVSTLDGDSRPSPRCGDPALPRACAQHRIFTMYYNRKLFTCPGAETAAVCSTALKDARYKTAAVPWPWLRAASHMQMHAT